MTKWQDEWDPFWGPACPAKDEKKSGFAHNALNGYTIIYCTLIACGGLG